MYLSRDSVAQTCEGYNHDEDIFLLAEVEMFSTVVKKRGKERRRDVPSAVG